MTGPVQQAALGSLLREAIGVWNESHLDRTENETHHRSHSVAKKLSEGEGKMSAGGPPEERVIWRKRFQAEHFDFRGKSIFTRFDGCEFVKCTLLMDRDTEQLAFTECVFKDCNIDKLEQDQERALYVRDNFFDRPLEERRADFEKRLAQALTERAKRK
jgi:hypothetical protein